MILRPSTWIGVVAAVMASLHAAAAQTETIDRPITIYVAGTAGGGIDLYGRVVGRHLGNHIPGKPTVAVQVMPGAGGIRAANYLAEQAPKDGSAMTIFAGGPILEPLIGARNPGYDMSQFTWIGAVAKDVSLCIAWGTTPFKTIDDAKKQQMIVAGTGAGSETDTWPVILNDMLGTKFKVVTGYLGTQETMVAMERGEVQGRCGLSLSSLKAAKPDWLPEHKINVLLQIALKKSPELPDVPGVFDLVQDQNDRQALELLVGPTAISRPFAAPPGVPAPRAALLRRAFAETMKDPAFLADAAKIRAEVDPSTGEEVQALVEKIYATPRAVVDRVKKYFVH